MENLATIRYIAALNPREAADLLGLKVTSSINDSCMWVLISALTAEDAVEQVKNLDLCMFTKSNHRGVRIAQVYPHQGLQPQGLW